MGKKSICSKRMFVALCVCVFSIANVVCQTVVSSGKKENSGKKTKVILKAQDNIVTDIYEYPSMKLFCETPTEFTLDIGKFTFCAGNPAFFHGAKKFSIDSQGGTLVYEIRAPRYNRVMTGGALIMGGVVGTLAGLALGGTPGLGLELAGVALSITGAFLFITNMSKVKLIEQY